VELPESGHSPYKAPPAGDPSSELQILQDMSHAFGSVRDMSELRASALRWVEAAVGGDCSIRLSLQEEKGRLQTVAQAGPVAPGGRGSSTRRRMAFESKTSMFLEREQGSVVAVLPLVCRGESVGVLEVAGPRWALHQRRRTLAAVASQIAIAVRHIRLSELLEGQVESLSSAAGVVGELVRAQTLEEATHAAMNLAFRVLQTPVAAWVLDGEGPELRFLGVQGVSGRRRNELKAAFPSMPRWSTTPTVDRAGLASRFANIMGVENVAVVDGGEAILLGGGEADALGGSLEVVRSLLQDTVRRLSAVQQAERRNQHLDTGIAWTAHEVRGPLLAAKAAMEAMLGGEDGSRSERHLLARSRDELAQLAGLVDAVLRWSVGAGPLRRRPIDLVRLVGQVAETCSLLVEDRRVVISGPEQLEVRMDSDQMRTAIANVVRNALSYSPPGSDVAVGVQTIDHHALVTVRDQGPGIPDSERHSIFDPFVRGGSAPVRTGKGLGLFVARKVVEAHGGAIWIDPGTTGGVFHILLPLNGEKNGSRNGNGRVHARTDHR
jgi:signal transduction histidine kinase